MQQLCLHLLVEADRIRAQRAARLGGAAHSARGSAPSQWRARRRWRPMTRLRLASTAPSSTMASDVAREQLGVDRPQSGPVGHAVVVDPASPRARPEADPCREPTSWCSPSGTRSGNLARHERPRPANVWVAAAVPATALLAAAADGPQSKGSLDPVPRSSKLTRVNWSFTAAGTSDARIGSIRTPLSPGSARIEDDDTLALRYRMLHHRQRHRAIGRVAIVQRDRARCRTGSPTPSGRATRRCARSTR